MHNSRATTVLFLSYIVRMCVETYGSVIRRLRCMNHEKTMTKKEFDSDVPFMLHWDGKLLHDISGNKELVDRIAVVSAILVTGGGDDVLLGVPTRKPSIEAGIRRNAISYTT